MNVIRGPVHIQGLHLVTPLIISFTSSCTVLFLSNMALFLGF